MTGSSDDAISTDELAERGASRDDAEWEERWRSVTPDDICTFIYTSGTTGPPKGCVISHGNYRSMLDMALDVRACSSRRRAHLPLPAPRPLVRAADPAAQLRRSAATLAYWERDPLKILPNLAEVKPHYFPSVPRIFEKIYTAATAKAEKAGGMQEGDLQLGDRRRPQGPRARAPGQEPGLSAAPPVRDRRPAGAVEHPQPVRRADHRGGHRRGPDQPRDPALLRRRRRARARGLGDDRDLDRGDDLDRRGVQVRHDRQAVPGLRGEDRRRRRDPRQGAERLPGLLQERGGDPRDARRRLAAHRRHRRDRRRRLHQDHRPQEGHHHHRGRQEHHARRTSRPRSSSTRWSRSAS